ncbi:hypothetical protein Lal_00042331 [Lupinus albus]|nr:hypothetical protein Lal_00042331 [Lupinus albus]
MKTTANRPRRTFETGGSSSATLSRPAKKRDPYFTPELQASKLVRFHDRKLAYVRYADVPWLVEEGFQFPHELEVQARDTSKLACRNSDGYVRYSNLIIQITCLRDFISRVIDHMEIDTSNVEIKLTNTHDHQLREYLIHKMGIYKITDTWMYQEDYRTTIDLDLLDEETPAAQQEQPAAPPEFPEASQAPPYGLAHMDALEQRLNQRVDVGLLALNDNMDSKLMNMYDRLAADIQRENDQTRGEIDRIAFILQTMSTGLNPISANKLSHNLL